jgi:hypothetical protein
MPRLRRWGALFRRLQRSESGNNEAYSEYQCDGANHIWLAAHFLTPELRC